MNSFYYFFLLDTSVTFISEQCKCLVIDTQYLKNTLTDY